MSPVIFDPEKDNEKTFDDEVGPLMAQVFDLCTKHGIPFAAAFQYADSAFSTYFIIPSGASQALVEMARVVRPDVVEAAAVKNETGSN